MFLQGIGLCPQSLHFAPEKGAGEVGCLAQVFESFFVFRVSLEPGNVLLEPGEEFRWRGLLREIGSESEVAEGRYGLTELGQSHLPGTESIIFQFDHLLAIDEAGDLLLFHAYAQAVPLTRVIGVALELPEDVPGEDIRTVETRETEAAAAGIESVVPVSAVRFEGEAGGPGLIVEDDLDSHLVGEFGPFPL